jgi:hypothetical protein
VGGVFWPYTHFFIVAGAKPIIAATSAQVRRYFSFIFSPVYDVEIFGKIIEKIS